MAWVENFLNLKIGYYKVTSSEGDSDQFEYLVPFPPGYTSTMKARWTTDVIVLEPSCSWQTGVQVSADPLHDLHSVKLLESNLTFTLLNDQLGMFLLSSNVFMCSVEFSIRPSQ
jgi:hypothetical protein